MSRDEQKEENEVVVGGMNERRCWHSVDVRERAEMNHGKCGYGGREATVSRGGTIWDEVNCDERARTCRQTADACDDINNHGLDVSFGASAALLKKWLDDFALAGV
jgi:hypothetical protein